jgi:hypothetical protein
MDRNNYGTIVLNCDGHAFPSSLQQHATKAAETESQPGADVVHRDRETVTHSGAGLISPFPLDIENIGREMPQGSEYAQTCIDNLVYTHSCMENVCLPQRRQVAPWQAQFQELENLEAARESDQPAHDLIRPGPTAPLIDLLRFSFSSRLHVVQTFELN